MQKDITADEHDTTEGSLKMNEEEAVPRHDDIKPDAVSPEEKRQCVESEIQTAEIEVRICPEDDTTEKIQKPNGGKLIK